jgi:HK97 family phage major capsid protein
MATETATLPELKGRINRLRGDLLKAFQEAGDQFDLSRVKIFSGTPAEKLDRIRQADRELEDLQQLVETRLDLVGTRLPASEPKRARIDVGDRLVKSDAFTRWSAKTKGPEVTLDMPPEAFGIGTKSVLSTSTFASELPAYLPPTLMEEIGLQPPNLAQAIPTLSTMHWRVRWLRELNITPAAGQTAEGDLSPEASLELSNHSDRLRKISVVLPTTEELLEDEATARGYINQRLSVFTQAQLDNQLLNGDGTGQNLIGFHATNGIDSETYSASGTRQDQIKSILSAAGVIADDGLAVADSVVIRGSDWFGFLATTTSTGDFIFEPNQAPQSFFGLRPIVSLNQQPGRYLVGAVQQHSLLVARPEIEVQVSAEHNDMFARGEVAIRTKLPAWLLVLRPAAFAEITSA